MRQYEALATSKFYPEIQNSRLDEKIIPKKHLRLRLRLGPESLTLIR